MKTSVISARINGKNIELFDLSGFRVGYASSTGMAFDEKWVSAYVNGNYLIASSDRGTTVTWELGATGSAVVVSRR
jgi:hypothetical protein